MYSKSLLLFFLLLITINLGAQVDYKSREFSITNDNDFYLLGDSDKYYSNGLILNYRWVPKEGLFTEEDSIKRIFDIELAQKLYTPQDLLFSNFLFYDRPYAGLLYTGFSLSQFKKKTSRAMIGLELGVVGKASGAQGFQEWYHNAVGFPRPRGWKFQIPNEFIFNFKTEFNKQFILAPGSLDVISSTEIFLGSAFTHIKQDFDFRVGKLQWLNQSSFTNALIGKRSEDIPRHNYLFIGYGLQYVLHNITIEGSIWDNDAIHTESVTPWVRHLRVGWVSSSDKATFKLIYNWSSPEVQNISRHAYLSFELQLRFASKK